MQPTLDEMDRRGAPFVGTLYVGLALTADGPRVIEFNCRFGDPDVQPVLALLTLARSARLLKAAADGDLGAVPAPTFADGASVTVVMASAGYPQSSSTGDVIVGTETLDKEIDVDVIHAGTARRPEGLVTAGGRVVAVRAIGSDVADARAKAYEGIATISFPGAQWRRDIAAEPLGVVEGASLVVTAESSAEAAPSTTALITRPDQEQSMTVPNVLATRYAAADLAAIWSPEHKIVLERRLWIAVLRAQRDLGIDVPDGVVEAYEAVVEQVDLELDRGPRADHPPRREGAHRGVRGARRARAHPQGDDEPRPDRERRAAPDQAVPGAACVTGPSRPWPGSRGSRPSTRPPSWPGAPTTSPRRPRRWASGSPPSPTRC